jgi:acyl-CoA synthetase (AMP-forming)/AMP-acid ligase II
MTTVKLNELHRYSIGTYADLVYRNALLHSDREAFIYGQGRVTFSEFNSSVNKLVHALQSMGLKKGDGIGVLSWNCIECAEIVGAAMKGGFIVSPLNPRLSTEELHYIINYSGVKTLFVGKELTVTIDQLRPSLPTVQHYISLEGRAPGMREYAELVLNSSKEEPDVQVQEDDPFIIFYTSGTTGVPRGAVYTHRSKMEDTRTKALLLGLQPYDKHVMVMPLFHIGGWSYFWTFFCVGASNVIMAQRSYDPAATLKTLQDEKATDIHIVPTHLVSMLGLADTTAYDLSSVKRIYYAASPMPLELLRKGIERFGPIFAQGYGQTESGPDITILPKEFHRVLDKSPEKQKVLSSCGQPCPGVHVKIVDESLGEVPPNTVGDIAVRSKSLMEGYWRMPDETAKTIMDGWLYTGDMGYYDEKGFIYIVDRKKDMIITGGENVYPREVEEVLYRHPTVLECAVIGVPDEKWVERVHALIVLREGQEGASDGIIAFCRRHLSGYKTPRSVEFVDALPKSPQGKILKRELKDRYRKART